jgi:thioredoxin-like negative regulator of GroEL
MQLIEVRRVSRGRKYVRRAVVVGVAAVIIGGWLAYDPAVNRYHAWKRRHALAQARAFIAQHDATNTQLALDVALNAGPSDPDTIRVAADLLEQVGAPQAMRLRRAVVRMSPDSATDAAALVMCNLRFGDYNGAKDALHAMPPDVAASTPALEAALAYALATDDAPVSDYILSRLRQKQPDNEALRFTQAILRLKLPRTGDREAAMAELDALVAKRPQLRTRLDRELAGAALQRQDYAEARSRLEAIVASPDATLHDRLQLANIDLLVAKRPFPEVFAALAPRASANETDAAVFVQWLVVQNRVDEAARWIETLPTSLRRTTGVQRMEADVAARRHEWEHLRPMLAAGVWGPTSSETLRLIEAALAVDSPSHLSVRHEVWDMALASGAKSLPDLSVLLRLTTAWHWEEEFERTEWTIARNFPDQTWAFQDLFNLYRRKKDATRMRDVLARLRETDPGIPRYQHDWALLTLLTDPSTKWDPAKVTLEQLYRDHPTDATYATAYALALAQAGRASEGVAVLAKLTPDERNFVPRQPFLAYVYGAAQMRPEFQHARELGANADYLPEEAQLFTRGAEELDRRPDVPAASTDTSSGSPSS